MLQRHPFLGFPAYLVISQSARERKEKVSETIKFMFKTCLFHGSQPELCQLGHAVPVGMEGIQRMIPSSQRGQVHQMTACFSDCLADDGIVRLGPLDDPPQTVDGAGDLAQDQGAAVDLSLGIDLLQVGQKL